jgi:3-hydroxyisobutyrate dehydrogenase-like beta-hydroxyacid dehydrogenase
LVLTEKADIPLEKFQSFLSLLFPNTPYVSYAQRMTSGEYHKRESPLFAIDLAKKDARHIMNLGKSVGVQMKGIELADEYFDVVKEEAGEKGDMAGMYGAVRKGAGLDYKK